MPRTKPRAAKDLEGDKSKGKVHESQAARLTVEAPQVVEDITCPDWLVDYGREEWDRIAPILKEMKLLTPMDTTTLAVYCSSYDDLRKAINALDANGGKLLTTGTKGQDIPHPSLGIRNRAYKNFLHWIGHFGLSPVSREKVLADAPKHDENDPLPGILAAGGNGANGSKG